jgi:hypothetical protein
MQQSMKFSTGYDGLAMFGRLYHLGKKQSMAASK